MNPAPAKGIESFPTPVIDDVVISEIVNSWKGDYQPLEYGVLWKDVSHAPNQGSFPEHKLVFQQPTSEDGQWVKRIWVNDRVNQDSYNYAIKYSAGSQEHPIYIRTYIVPRETYAPLLDGTPDPLFPGALLVDEEANRNEGELDSKYITVTRVYETIPGPEVPTRRYNERGDLETVIVQTVPPNTPPTADGLLVTQSQVEQVETGKGVKTTATVQDHALLQIKEKKEGLLGETITTDDIVDPSTNPDPLSQTVIASVVEQYTATKARKRTTTSTGPTSLIGKQNKNGLLGNTVIVDSIVPKNSNPDNLSISVISSEVSPIDSVKSKKTTISSEGPTSLSSSILSDTPTGAVKSSKVNSIVESDTKALNDYFTLKSDVNAIDNAKSESEVVKVDYWPQVYGVEYDDVVGVPIRYAEQVVRPSEYDQFQEWSIINDRSYKPIDEYKSLKKEYNRDEIHKVFQDQYYVVQTQIQVSLPNKLLNVIAYTSSDYGQGGSGSQARSVGGDSYSYSIDGGYKSSAAVNADIYFKLENGFSGYLNGEKHIFFMPIDRNGKVNKTILSELNDRNPGKNYKDWPVIRRTTENIIVFTGSKSRSDSGGESVSVSPNGFSNASSGSFSYDVNRSVSSITLPDALHDDISIQMIDIGPQLPTELDVKAEILPSQLTSTNPPRFPVGNYLMSSSMELYKWGLVKITAETVDITEEYT
jgi:hypothetical protein